MPGSWLLPSGENRAHIVQNSWADLYPRDQLDFDDIMLGRHYWFPRHKTHKQCIRYVKAYTM